MIRSIDPPPFLWSLTEPRTRALGTKYGLLRSVLRRQQMRENWESNRPIVFDLWNCRRFMEEQISGRLPC